MTDNNHESQTIKDDALLSHYLLQRRTQLGLRAKDVAKRANVSPRSISEAEHGTNMPTGKTLDDILKALECSYNQDEEIVEKYRKLIQRFFVDVITLCHDEENLTLELFRSNANQIKQSKAYPYYVQARTGKLILNPIGSNDISEIQANIEEMKYLSDYMEPAYRLYYYEILLFFHNKQQTLREIEDQLDDIHRYMNCFKPNCEADYYIVAYLHFRLVEVCRKLELYSLSMEHYNEAMKRFTDLCCFVRFPDLALMRANVLMESNNLHEASTIYQRLVENRCGQNSLSIVTYALNNLSWYQMIDGDYEAAIHYTKRLLYLSGIDDDTAINLPYCYWHTRQFDLAQEALVESYTYASNPLTILALDIVKILVSRITKKSVAAFKKNITKLVTVVEAHGGINEKLFIYRLATDGFEFLEDYASQSYYLELLLELKQSTVVDRQSM